MLDKGALLETWPALGCALSWTGVEDRCLFLDTGLRDQTPPRAEAELNPFPTVVRNKPL